MCHGISGPGQNRSRGPILAAKTSPGGPRLAAKIGPAGLVLAAKSSPSVPNVVWTDFGSDNWSVGQVWLPKALFLILPLKF